ncbi:unnamed protein product [Rotaria magnacalcarata]|uniref:Cullin family profile domain-containing protein n=1 Tax=Rotaria magnacalcarata TaxID=392030 RepID=A0A816YDR6_9BILA|nr:unnamed protein product [Rotaria magnacalcarata]
MPDSLTYCYLKHSSSAHCGSLPCRNNIAGGDLYDHIETSLRNKLNSILHSVNDMTDTDTIELYERHVRYYDSSCRRLGDACDYLNRHWVRRNYDNARTHIYEINELAQRIWRETLLKPLFPYIKEKCLNFIKKYRIDKSSIDIEVIRKIIGLYLDENFQKNRNELIDEDSSSKPVIDVYTEYFEIEFLQDAEDFYRQQNVRTLTPESISEYLSEISEYYDFEITFAKSFLPKSKSTLDILINKLEEIYLTEHNLSIIMDKMKTIVSNENTQDLRHLYELIGRIPKINKAVAKLIENHVYENGIGDITIKDSETFVDTIIDIQKKFLEIFYIGPKFKCALDKAFHKLINHNAITLQTGTTTKSAELLARYCDTFLKKRHKTMTETDVEEKFKQILIIFKYIDDKDIFEKFYGKMLVKRLIHELSVSHDDEKSMIMKLKDICGLQYTSKCEQILQDIDVSKTLTDDYRNDIVDFSVKVLSSNSWPFSLLQNIILSTELKATFDSFQDFYISRHHGRKLIWIYEHSKGELQLQTDSTEKKYKLLVSTYQMIVLLLFNEKVHWTVGKIQKKTQIQFEFLVQVLCSLLKSKILFSKEISDIKMNHIIEFNDEFQNNEFRINLNEPLKSNKQKDLQHLNQSIDEDRKLVIQAAIIRIMKPTQRLKYSLLVQQVIEKLSSRFTIKFPLVKKCIDLLIDKEYLEHESDERDILRYLS